MRLEVALEDAALPEHRKDPQPIGRDQRERIPPALSRVDEDDDPEERLPRRIEMNIMERGRMVNEVRLRMQLQWGQHRRPTDGQQDRGRRLPLSRCVPSRLRRDSGLVTRDSPVLFKVKRKSKPSVDENQDGARAQLVEEGIATWIFAHARELDYFKSIGNLDYSLLKAIEPQVKGYEVERCPLWLWEKAILDGYRVFRCLREQTQRNRHCGSGKTIDRVQAPCVAQAMVGTGFHLRHDVGPERQAAILSFSAHWGGNQ